MKLPEIEILLQGTWDKSPVPKQTPPRFVLKYELEYHPVPWGDSIVNGQVSQIDGGTFTFNRPGDIRSTVPASDRLRAEFLFFHVISDPDETLTRALEEIAHVIQGNPPLLDAWQKIKTEAAHPGNEHRTRAHISLMDLLFTLSGERKTSPPRPLPTDRQKTLFRAIRFMKENLDKNRTVEEMASVTGYSPSHFNHLFKTCTGRTPHEYYRALKLREAKVLLVTTEHSVTRIAEELGFCNVSEFGQAFKQDCGLTPRQFRKTYDKETPIYE